MKALLAVAVILAQGTALRGQIDPVVAVKAVRFYRADGSQTRVNAFIQVPYALLEPAGTGPGAVYVYRVQVQVADSAGMVLLHDAWSNRPSASVGGPGAFSIDMVHFSLAPGRYRLAVSVEDSVSGRTTSDTVDLEGFRTRPELSDLLLSPQVRPVTADDTIPKSSEMRWGQTLVTAAARLELTPLRTRAYYLLEAYSDRDVPGTLILRVLDSSGAKLLQTAPATVRVPAGGGLLKGQVDLAGLPPGHYRMLAVLSLDGGPELQRSGEFDMAGFEETLQKDVARREAEREADEGFFAQMSDLDLDEAEAPLALIAGSPELRVYDSQMSPDAKRRFLTEFWARRDPTPGTVRNETRLAFYAAVDYANRVYREGGRNRIAGWRTDRGRIYVRNGPPSDILRRQQQGKAPPYEVWSYQTGKSRYYCFADRTGFGAYKLLYSNDLKETSMPNWRQLLTEEAVTDVGRFLGIDFYSQSGPQ